MSGRDLWTVLTVLIKRLISRLTPLLCLLDASKVSYCNGSKESLKYLWLAYYSNLQLLS